MFSTDKLILIAALSVPLGVAAVGLPQVVQGSSFSQSSVAAFMAPSAPPSRAQVGAPFSNGRARPADAPPPTLTVPVRPSPTPVPTPQPTPAAPPLDVAGVQSSPQYTVKPGDELRYIAAQYGVTMSAIMALNTIPDADNLRVGQVLTLPDTSPRGSTAPAPAGSASRPPAAPLPDAPAAARTYTVQPGDRLRYIAAQAGVSIADILALNRVPNPDNLVVGQVLTLPSPPPAR